MTIIRKGLVPSLLLLSLLAWMVSAPPSTWAQAGRPAPAPSAAPEDDETPADGLTHHTFGVGVYGQTFGFPPGATFKYWFRDAFAGQFDMGYKTGDAQLIVIRMSYLSHDIAPLLRNIIPLYAGLGFSVVVAGEDESVKDLNGGVLRVPLGVDFLFRRYPLELFVEAAPGVRLAKETKILIDSSIGLRFYFW
ncbi:MAG: hypothetical protein HYY13_10005 [Nitrospirae bacterium]|nr:hypothetical protein [Nitrospirota bacterium]